MTFIRFRHFIAALSVLLEEAGKMCLFRRKIQYLYLPACFITQQPVASALFKDWQHSPREQHRCLQGETLTRLENTLWIEPKHSASSCGDFTLGYHAINSSFFTSVLFPLTSSPCLWVQTFWDVQEANKKPRTSDASWTFFLSFCLLTSGWVLQGVLP